MKEVEAKKKVDVMRAERGQQQRERKWKEKLKHRVGMEEGKMKPRTKSMNPYGHFPPIFQDQIAPTFVLSIPY